MYKVTLNGTEYSGVAGFLLYPLLAVPFLVPHALIAWVLCRLIHVVR